MVLQVVPAIDAADQAAVAAYGQDDPGMERVASHCQNFTFMEAGFVPGVAAVGALVDAIIASQVEMAGKWIDGKAVFTPPRARGQRDTTPGGAPHPSFLMSVSTL